MHTDLQHRTEAEKIVLAALFGCQPDELTDEMMDRANQEREGCYRHCVEVAESQLTEEARLAAIPAEQIEARKSKLKHDLFLLDNAEAFTYEGRLRRQAVEAELVQLGEAA